MDMKKNIAIAAAVLLTGAALAGGVKVFSVSATGPSTNSTVRSVAGELIGVGVTVPAGATGTVTLASGDGVYYTNTAMTASAMLTVRAPVYSAAGVAYTNGANMPVVDAIPVNGLTTATVYQTSATTNTWTIRALYR